jgi:hypothetical protein
MTEIKLWENVRLIRSYVSARIAALEKNGTVSEEIASWAAQAMEFAERLDPLRG